MNLYEQILFLHKVNDTYSLHRIDAENVNHLLGDSHHMIYNINPFYKLDIDNCKEVMLNTDRIAVKVKSIDDNGLILERDYSIMSDVELDALLEYFHDKHDVINSEINKIEKVMDFRDTSIIERDLSIECKHENTSTYFVMGSEYDIRCNDCGTYLE